MWKIIGAANAKKEEPNGSGKPDIQPEAKPEAKKAFSCVCVWGVYMGPQCITCLPHFGLQMCLCACFPCGRPTAKCGQARNMPLDLIMKICKKPPVFQKQVGSEL